MPVPMLTRLGFVFVLVTAGGGAALLATQACSSDGGGAGEDEMPGAPPTVANGDAVYTTSVDDDHTHVFAIAMTAFAMPEDLEGPTSVVGGHTHDVIVHRTALKAVANGETATVTTSTVDGHAHVLTIVAVH
jgi:hypothetical protein